MTLEQLVAFWDAVNRYAEACGGDTGNATVGERRMLAVAAIGRELELERERTRAAAIATLAESSGIEAGPEPHSTLPWCTKLGATVVGRARHERANVCNAEGEPILFGDSLRPIDHQLRDASAAMHAVNTLPTALATIGALRSRVSDLERRAHEDTLRNDRAERAEAALAALSLHCSFREPFDLRTPAGVRVAAEAIGAKLRRLAELESACSEVRRIAEQTKEKAADLEAFEGALAMARSEATEAHQAIPTWARDPNVREAVEAWRELPAIFREIALRRLVGDGDKLAKAFLVLDALSPNHEEPSR